MINYEIDWLDQVSLSNLGKCSSWSKHHSAQVAPSTVTPGIHSMLPLIKKVAYMKAQYHCMSIIHKTIKFLNENQIPTDVSDQPVCAYSKEVQWRHSLFLALPHYFWSWKIFVYSEIFILSNLN